MPAPHIPAWLEDVTANLVATHESEAVLLVGSHARGTATPASGYDLLVIVDNDRVPERGIAPRYRWEQLDGFAAPVFYLRTSLAELMAGGYAASEPWVDLLHDTHVLHDPTGMRARIDAQRSAARTPGAESALAVARHDAGEALRLHSAGATVAAHLAAVRVADALGSWIAREAERSPLVARDVAGAVAQLSPGAARAFDEVLHASDAELRMAALERFIDAVEASLRLHASRE